MGKFKRFQCDTARRYVRARAVCVSSGWPGSYAFVNSLKLTRLRKAQTTLALQVTKLAKDIAAQNAIPARRSCTVCFRVPCTPSNGETISRMTLMGSFGQTVAFADGRASPFD